MKNALLSTAVAGSVFLIGLGVSGSAMAGDRYKGHHGYSGSHYSGHHSGYRGHSNRHYKRSHRRHRNNEGAALAFGLIFGSILGHAISSSNQTRVYGNTSQTVEVVPQYRYSQGTCLQEREYQTKVFVGGKAVDAYGTACLQRDGSWQRGPLTLSGSRY